MEARLPQLDRADQRWRGRALRAVGETKIGVVVGLAQQVGQAEGPQPMPPDDPVPDGRLGGQRLAERLPLWLAGLDAKRLGDGRPDILSDEDVAVRDVEGLARCGRRLRRPGQRPREEPRVDCLQQIGRPAGE